MKNGRNNVLRVHLKGKRFEMNPCLPTVKLGYEPLIVGVDWSENEATWKRIVLKEFAFADGSPCQVDPTEVAFDDGNRDERQIAFKFTVAEDTEIKFTVELHQSSPSQVIGIDPVVLGKPGP